MSDVKKPESGNSPSTPPPSKGPSTSRPMAGALPKMPVSSTTSNSPPKQQSQVEAKTSQTSSKLPPKGTGAKATPTTPNAQKENKEAVVNAANELDESGFPLDPLNGLTEEERIQQFVLGNITLSQFQNISRDQLYSLAEIGNNFYKQGQYEKARAIFEGLVVMDPTDSWLHLTLGLCFSQLGNDYRAVQELDRAVFLNEFSIQARLERAEILMKYGEIEPAILDLGKAIELDKKGEDPYALRARILLDALKAMVESKVSSNPSGE